MNLAKIIQSTFKEANCIILSFEKEDTHYYSITVLHENTIRQFDLTRSSTLQGFDISETQENKESPDLLSHRVANSINNQIGLKILVRRNPSFRPMIKHLDILKIP